MDPMWQRWQRELNAIRSELRLTASEMGVSEKELVTRQHLFDAATLVEKGAYELEAVILTDGAEEE